MRELPKVMAGIEASVRTGNKDGQLAAYLKELEFSSLLVTSLPDDFVAAAIRLLRDDAFLLLPDSWLLVGFLNNNWGLLTLEHRNKVNPILLKAFDRFGDWMGAFVISEILGERYCDEASLDALRGLSRTARQPARQLAPHGLEYLARTSEDDGLRKRARRALEDLVKSTDAEVRREATISLGKLKKGERPDSR